MPYPITQQNEPNTQTATIAATGNLSPAVQLPVGHELAAILMPAVWTAAGITFQAAYGNGSYANVFAAGGSEYALVCVALSYVVIPPGVLHGANWIKIRSGTSGSAVAQVAARTLTLITRPTS